MFKLGFLRIKKEILKILKKYKIVPQTKEEEFKMKDWKKYNAIEDKKIIQTNRIERKIDVQIEKENSKCPNRKGT